MSGKINNIWEKEYIWTMQYRNEDYNPIFHDRFKALSVKQPYAEYIASGDKAIEVRSRPTKYRGELLICASKDGKPTEEAQGYGCTLAFVELYGCKPLSELTDKQWAQTKLPANIIQELKTKGRGWGWMLRNPRRVIEFPVKGQLGIFNLVYTKDVIIPYPEHLNRPVVK